MQPNIYVYIAVMALVTYLIRVLPLTLIRRQIQNRTIRSFLFYMPYATLAVMGRYDFPGNSERNRYPVVGSRRLDRRRCDGMARLLSVHRRKRRLRRRVRRRMRLALTPARRRNKAFAQAFLERLAGSQGRALSRVPQDTNSPIDSRCPTRESTKNKNPSLASASESLPSSRKT